MYTLVYAHGSPSRLVGRYRGVRAFVALTPCHSPGTMCKDGAAAANASGDDAATYPELAAGSPCRLHCLKDSIKLRPQAPVKLPSGCVRVQTNGCLMQTMHFNQHTSIIPPIYIYIYIMPVKHVHSLHALPPPDATRGEQML